MARWEEVVERWERNPPIPQHHRVRRGKRACEEVGGAAERTGERPVVGQGDPSMFDLLAEEQGLDEAEAQLPQEVQKKQTQVAMKHFSHLLCPYNNCYTTMMHISPFGPNRLRPDFWQSSTLVDNVLESPLAFLLPVTLFQCKAHLLTHLQTFTVA